MNKQKSLLKERKTVVLALLTGFMLIFSASIVTSCSEDSIPVNVEPDIVDTEIFDGFVHSCQHFLASVPNSTWNEFLIITGNTQELMPDTESHSYNLSDAENLSIAIHQYHFDDGTDKAGCFEYCNDVVCGSVDLSKDIWEAIEGTVILQRTEIEKDDPQIINHYTIDITVQDPVFLIDGDRFEAESFLYEDVGAGRFPG